MVIRGPRKINKKTTPVQGAAVFYWNLEEK
jgi:hypothetical protein